MRLSVLASKQVSTLSHLEKRPVYGAIARPLLGRVRLCGSCKLTSGRRKLSVVAFKEQDQLPNSDWRVKKLVDVSKVFFGAFLSKGDLEAGGTVLDDGVVYRDNMFWGAGMLVGSHAVKEYVSDLRYKYPDIWYEVDQMALQDDTHVWIAWTGHGTNLEEHARAASYHNSTYSGVSILTFNKDRTKIVEVSTFRQPTAEERHDMEHPEHDPFEIKLARLHVEPPAAHAAGSRAGAAGSKRPRPSSSNGRRDLVH
eukprot:CAMPEP_0202891438 /NCGR_PEP_ID=MMETSP1392-20130828/1492_1 /ASSEMBLY_ACC=CAM_ASM_000868 /TAXON_ID=225041 /ORGANISM="Chlamydomonas chlamydogama, Strain SAG 11-48b" /LENGTH=253 /DNA_ID=CAMNT_0049575185 /DNA_START=105 /DNA_END=866 /DNA_ORIENTATION=+